MTVSSRDRDFDVAAAKVTWQDYAKPPEDRTAIVDPGMSKAVNPELARVAARFKAELPPPAATSHWRSLAPAGSSAHYQLL
jgi:hypothetical protein